MSSLATVATRHPVAVATGTAMNLNSAGIASEIEYSRSVATTTALPIWMDSAFATASFWVDGLNVETKVSVSSSVVLAQPTSTAREMRMMATIARIYAKNRRRPDPNLVGALSWSWDCSFSFTA